MDAPEKAAGTTMGDGQELDASIAGLQKAFVARLGELRRRLLFAAGFLIGFSVLGYGASSRVLQLLTAQHPGLVALIFLSPAEAFFSQLKLALAIGFSASFPFLLGQVWSFVRPFLNKRQQTVSFLLIPVCYLFFLLGAGVAYKGLLPVVLGFFLGFRSENLEPMLSVSPYISFVLALVLPMGLLFQLPVVVMFLARIGILRPQALAARRRYVILGCFVLGALLTPPDAFSQVMMAIPLILLFELSLLFARLAAPRRSSSGGEENELAGWQE